MKLVVVLVAFAVLWLLLRASVRRMRHGGQRRDAPSRRAGGAVPMLECAQCGVHLPRDEALPGRGGVFCCEAHRAVYEKGHPAP